MVWDWLGPNRRQAISNHHSVCNYNFPGITSQYIPRNMHTVSALLCFVVVIHWLIFPYPSGLFHWHRGNLTIAPVPAKQPWWIWINASCEFIMSDCITTTKQSTTKPCAYFLGYTVRSMYTTVLSMEQLNQHCKVYVITMVWDALAPKRHQAIISRSHDRWLFKLLLENIQ